MLDLMYFNPFGFSSPVVNTDASGFRYTEARNRSYSVSDLKGESRVRVLAGNLTVFGIGASLHRHLLGQLQSGRVRNTLVAPQGGVYAAHPPCAREMAQPRRSLALAEADQ